MGELEDIATELAMDFVWHHCRLARLPLALVRSLILGLARLVRCINRTPTDDAFNVVVMHHELAQANLA